MEYRYFQNTETATLLTNSISCQSSSAGRKYFFQIIPKAKKRRILFTDFIVEIYNRMLQRLPDMQIRGQNDICRHG